MSTRAAHGLFSFIIAASIALTPAPPSSADSTDSQWIEALASADGVSVGEALRRAALEVAVGRFKEAIAQSEPSYAGMWIERKPGFRAVIAFAGPHAPALGLAAQFGVADILVEQDAAISLARLTMEAQAIRSVAATVPFDVAVDVSHNRVEVRTGSQASFDALMVASGHQVPSFVTVSEVVATAAPLTSMYGGLPIDPSGCTTGFAIRWNGTSTLGVTTAGHCSNTNWYAGYYSLPFQYERFSGPYDIQWHTAPGLSVTHLIYDGIFDGDYIRPITSRRYRSNQTIGDFVCKYGRTTHQTCGYIVSKTVAPGFIPNATATYLQVNYPNQDLGAEGDSGGPVYSGQSALGTVSFKSPYADGDDLGYMAVDYLESGLSSAVLTS